MTRDHKYTATVYTNSHIIGCVDGNDLCRLTASLLVHLDDSDSGSIGTITDNNRGIVVQRFCKSVIDD